MLHRVRRKKQAKTSGIEKTVEQWLTDAGADYRTQYPISRIHVDFFFPAEFPTPTNKGTVLEVNGCYWHKHSCIKKGKWKPSEARKRAKDARRYKFLMGRGYKLKLLWECEIEKSPETAKEKVLSYAN